MPVIVQKEVQGVSPTSNVVIEQVDVIGSFRRIYDFDYDQMCLFYNHSAHMQSGGGLSCRFYHELPPKVQKRFDDVCKTLSARKTDCPDRLAPPIGMPGVYLPSATAPYAPPGAIEGSPGMYGDDFEEYTPDPAEGVHRLPKFQRLNRGQSFTPDELRGVRP